MALVMKYRLGEVAKDFGVPNKEISSIMAEYFTPAKNHMQVLADEELDVIFEYMTQHNQVESLEEIFVVTPIAPPAPEAPAAPAPEAAKEEKPKQAAKGAQEKPAKSAQGKADQKAHQEAKPAQQQGQPSAQPAQNAPAQKQKQNKPYTPRQVAEKRVVDTRGGSAVNIDKYNEKYEDLGSNKTNNSNMRRGNKEKIQSKSKQRTNPQAASAKRRQEERDKMARLQLEIARKQQLKVQIPDEISVGDLAARMKKTASEVIKNLMKMGTFASISDVIDYDTAALVAMELGCKVEKEVIVTVEERLIDDSQDKPEDLVTRAPVVVVMGHVDHGKTSLLDYIRNSNVASGEAGGITQAIGAYTVEIDGKPITFLDTPGHEAFTSMRARGAMVTDIAILVVAADDGIMPQTVESINHAKAANIPIVVAINKMDVTGANPERIKQQLTEYDLVAEEWGGDTIVCPISAKTGMGIENLLENLTILAEVQELKANPNRAAKGAVIEARLDKGRGPIMTVLVQNGTLKQGDIIIAGTAVGRVRTMVDDKGRHITKAGPSTPVEISGLSEVPSAGDVFNAVSDERMARELAEERRIAMSSSAGGLGHKVSLEDLFSQIQAGESAVGAINESDVMLAATSGAIIVGFNVRPDAAARDNASRNDVDIRLYRVIYDCINEIEAAMKGMLAPKFKELIIGHAEVRETYKVSKVGTVCGCYCTDGKIQRGCQRGCQVRILRDNIVVHEGELASLRRFKDDVREVASGYECGMQVEKFNDIKVGDVIECFVMEQIAQ